MSKTYIGDAKESTSQEIKSMLTPKSLADVVVLVTDFVHDDKVISKGGLNSNERTITT